MSDNIERAGPDMSKIKRDTFGETLEYRIRIKSNAHVSEEFFEAFLGVELRTTLFDILFVKENRNFHREE